MTASAASTIDIRVGTPLPSSILLTLGNLIEAAWPGAELATNEDRHTSQVVFRVNPAGRQIVVDDSAAAMLIEPAEDDLEITSLGPEGVKALTPESIATNLVPVIRAAFEEFPDAENYLEMPLKDPADGHRYLLTFCRSAAQTPHELRLAAEADLVKARAVIHGEYAAALASLQRLPRTGGRPDTYEEGIRAMLDAVRELGGAFAGTAGGDD